MLQSAARSASGVLQKIHAADVERRRAVRLDGECVIAACCRSGGRENCGQCGGVCELKKPLIAEFNGLGIADMAEVTDLNALLGSFVNLEYPLPNGQSVRLLEDEKMYLGNQIEKKGSSRCYGIVADDDFLLVCEYGESGSDPEIILYKKRTK